MKHWKIWQKSSIKAKLPDVSAIAAARAPQKDSIILRNASARWAEHHLLCVPGFAPSAAIPAPPVCAAPALPHPSPQLPERRHREETDTYWNSREGTPDTKLGVCHGVFWRSFFQKKPSVSTRCRIMEYGRKKCPRAKIFYENSYHECGWGIKLSLPTERNDTSLRKLLKPLFVSEIYDIPLSSDSISYCFDSKIPDTRTDTLPKLRRKFSCQLI